MCVVFVQLVTRFVCQLTDECTHTDIHAHCYRFIRDQSCPELCYFKWEHYRATALVWIQIIAVGDLYQLPCVQKSRRFTQQIYGSDLWPEFAFAELTESCRVLTGEVAFAEFLSRARKGYKHLIQSDHDMLKSRFCQHHCAVYNTQYPGTDS